MNRRSFFGGLAGIIACAAAPNILVPSQTYRRVWKPTVLRYRANTIGIYQQLRDCSRVIDLNPSNDLSDFFSSFSKVKESRPKSDTIDLIIRESELDWFNSIFRGQRIAHG